jgi:hypothetical protein
LLGGNDENYETLQSGQPICRLGWTQNLPNAKKC